jgi:voltage-gated sodium channel
VQKADQYADALRKFKKFDEIEPPPEFYCDTWQCQLFIGFVIVVNALFIGLETDMNKPDGSMHKDQLWFVMENVFVCIFVVEMIVKISCHQLEYFKQVWNLIDFGLVMMAIVDVWILKVLNSEGNMKSVSVLRVVRMLRLVRLIRLFRVFKELWLVVSGLIESMRTLGWVSILLVLFVYVCGIFVTMQIGHNPEQYDEYKLLSGGWDHQEYFGTVTRSMYTLFQVITLESWSSGIARHVITNQPSMLLFFLVFLMFTHYGLLNIVVGVIVEMTLSAARRNEEKIKQEQDKEQKRTLEHLKDIFKLADEDGSGDLDRGEFFRCLQNPTVEKKMKLIQLPLAEARNLFEVLDADGQGSLSIDEFIGGCLRLKGSAKSKDLLSVQLQVECLAKKMDEMEVTLGQNERKMEALDKVTLQMSRRYESSIEEAHRRMALAIGSGAPVVMPKKKRHEVDLSVGNKPMLPPFPSFLS